MTKNSADNKIICKVTGIDTIPANGFDEIYIEMIPYAQSEALEARVGNSSSQSWKLQVENYEYGFMVLITLALRN